MKRLYPILALVCILGMTASSYSQLGDCYTTREELYDLIFALQDSFPQYVMVDSIGHSRGQMLDEEYPIYAVKFSDNVQTFEDEPTALIIGHIHAEEVAGLESMVRFMRLLAHRRMQEPYRTLINETQIYFIPTMNPDGLEIISSGYEVDGDTIWDLTWRKNGYRPPELQGRECNISPGIGNDSCGVDLNRNFGLNWILGDTLWHPTASEPFDYFRGPGVFSEPEARAVRDFATQIKPTTSVVWHSSRSGNVSERCIVAWKWGIEPEPFKYPPDSLAINHVLGNIDQGYVSKTVLWPALSGHFLSVLGGTRNGDLQDWFYWKLATIQILTETGPPEQIQPPCDGPEQNRLESLKHALVPPAEWMCRRLINMPGTEDTGDMDSQGAPLAIYTKDASTNEAISAEWRIVNTWTPFLPPWYTNEAYGRATFLPPPGQVTIMARKEGYRPDTVSTTINPGAYATAEVTLYLEPLPWYTMNLRVEDEAGNAIPARIHLKSEFPQWLELPEGEVSVYKPVSAYELEIIPEEDANKIAIWRHFWFHTDSSFTFVVPAGGEAMSENFETGGLDNWTSGGEGDTWDLTTDTTAMVYGNSLHTNPNPSVFRPVYENNADTWIEYNNVIDLTDDNAAHLRFDRRGRMDMPDDSLFVEVSTDGSTWDYAKAYSDIEVPWTRDWVSLSPWAGQSIHLRFRLQTDISVRELGYHLDNLSIVSGIDTDTDEYPELIPFTYRITNAYPNPFNSTTTIAYEVAAPGPVTFAIFNLLGREVYRVEEQPVTAGPHRLRWEGSTTSGQALASGIYFIRMQTDAIHASKKLMLLK